MASDLAGLRPTPLYFLGDSTTLVYADSLYRRDSTGEYFIGRSLYINDFAAASFSDNQGELDATVLSSMEAHGLLVRDINGIEAFHRAPQLHWKRVARAQGRSRGVPYLVLSAGGLDLVRFFHEINDNDFDLPRPMLHHEILPAACLETRPTALSYATVSALLEPAVAGLDRAIVRLAELGFTRLFVNSLLPFTLDDAAFRHYMFVNTSVSVRYKSVYLLNHLIHEMCLRRGVHFVDAWRHQVVNGYAKPNLFIEGIHLTPEHAAETVHAFFELLDGLKPSTTVQ